MAHSHKGKKTNRKEKRIRSSHELLKRSESFRFCYLGMVVWLPVFLYALRIGFELTLWQD
jgi:hypothetical protein